MLCSVVVNLLVVVTPLCARRTGGGSSIGRGQSGAHYPPSTGLSGNTNTYKSGHTYPHSTGLSGNYVGQRSNYNSYNSNYNPKPQVHHHYHYNPPQHISYGATQHPVYHGTPPVYVYEYRNSGSRYDSLLTGLALYNLGRMSANHNHGYHSGTEYRSPPGETCKMRIERNRVEYEETRIDCRLISSFILEAPKETSNVVIQTVTTNVTKDVSINGTSNISVTTTVQNTTVADALSVKGPSVQVSPGMQCFVIRHARYGTDLKRKVDCGLLQEYARSSMRYSGSNRLIPDLAIIVVVIYIINLWRHLYSS